MLKLGTQNISALYLGGQKIGRAYLGETPVLEEKKTSRLPEGYTEVEYITLPAENGSRVYFPMETNVICNKDRIYYKVKPRKKITSTASTAIRQLLFMTSKISSNTFIIRLSLVAEGVYFMLNTYSGSNPVKMETEKVILEFDIDFQNGVYTVNGNKMSGTRSSNSIGSEMRYIGGSPTTWTFHGDIYQLTHYRNGEILRDYIPCVSPEGVVGFYELTLQKFISNSASGEVTAGPAVQ